MIYEVHDKFFLYNKTKLYTDFPFEYFQSSILIYFL